MDFKFLTFINREINNLLKCNIAIDAAYIAANI